MRTTDLSLIKENIMDMFQRIINLVFVIEHIILVAIAIGYAIYWIEDRPYRKAARRSRHE
jgi:hypothetical protein